MFVKFQNFFSDLLGAVCLLNFARRTAHEFSAFGFITTRVVGGPKIWSDQKKLVGLPGIFKNVLLLFFSSFVIILTKF